MSLIATQALSILNELFPPPPMRRVVAEHYILYKGTKLYFDFYIPEYSLFVECQGQQHFNFVPHFHGDASGYKDQKKRDNLKIEYIQDNNLYLVYLNYNEIITKDLLYTKIHKAMDDNLNICR